MAEAKAERTSDAIVFALEKRNVLLSKKVRLTPRAPRPAARRRRRVWGREAFF
jgi:hypothetical protein